MKRIRIDAGTCIKSGQCYYLHPRLVRRGEDNGPVVVARHLAADELEEADSLLDVCPTGAIELVDEGADWS